jgi:hypothetical protein
LLSYFYSKGKTSSKGDRREVSSGTPISRRKPVRQQISLFLLPWVRELVEGTVDPGDGFSLFILYFYLKVHLLEWGDSFCHSPNLLSPMESNLLGRSFHYFLLPLCPASISTQTEVWTRKWQTDLPAEKKGSR